jgi:hypothetical protein
VTEEVSADGVADMAAYATDVTRIGSSVRRHHG